MYTDICLRYTLSLVYIHYRTTGIQFRIIETHNGNTRICHFDLLEMLNLAPTTNTYCDINATIYIYMCVCTNIYTSFADYA